MKERLFVAAKAVIANDGKILILREAKKSEQNTSTIPGKYQMPGGRLEDGESVLDALHREVYEETGLSVSVAKPLYVQEWRPVVRDEQWHIVAIFFACDSSSRSVTISSEHDDYQWITPVEYKKYPIIEDEHPVIQRYLEEYVT